MAKDDREEKLRTLAALKAGVAKLETERLEQGENWPEIAAEAVEHMKEEMAERIRSGMLAERGPEKTLEHAVAFLSRKLPELPLGEFELYFEVSSRVLGRDVLCKALGMLVH